MIKRKSDSEKSRQIFGGRHMGRLAAVSLLLVILLALPPTWASEGAATYTLEIYGNANMDENLDDADISYVQDIIGGTKQSTKLADANFDGRVDALDAEQIERVLKGDAENLTVIDAQKRNVTIKLPVQRAVSVNTGAIEILRDIGVDINNVFVGVSSYAIANSKYWPELKDKESIIYGSPDYEQLAKLKTDLVILYKNPKKDEAFDKYDAIGVPVICLDCFNQEGLDGSIKILGEIFNKRDKSNELIDWYQGYIDLVRERTKNLDASEKPKTMFYSYPDSNYPIVKVCNNKSGDHPMIVEAGGINIGEDLNSSSGVAEVDREWILSSNPDVIIGTVVAADTKSGYSADEEKAFGFMHMVRDKLMVDQAIKQTNAAAQGKVYITCTDLNRGPMQAAGTVYMAKILHPDLFRDINPEDVLKEYFDKWQGIPYQGIYIYPPLQ